MKVSDILRVKGSTLYTCTPEDTLSSAATLMADNDMGSLVVMSHGKVVGMLTFREVIKTIVKNGGAVGDTTVWRAMDKDRLPVNTIAYPKYHQDGNEQNRRL